MSGYICGFCGKKLRVRNGQALPCANLACQCNRDTERCEIERRGWALLEPTNKQLELIAKLAAELETLTGEAHDTGAHCRHCASVRIENYIAGVKYFQRKN